MMSMKNSQDYTYKAVESFNKHTKLRAIDKFILIDNDNSIENEVYGMFLLKNAEPKSFSQNINLVLSAAIQDEADFVLMSNDVIFTPDWFEPLITSDTIMLPMSNQNITEQTDKFKTSFTMDLSEYIGHENDLDIIAKKITSKNLQFNQPRLIPYYCFYLPYLVSSNVGLFDETFGQGGGEDVDYRLRALAKGYETKLSPSSYILHFMGRSTWKGGEDPQESIARNEIYKQRFISKWGQEAANFYLDTSLNSFLIA